jgi:hypothetical protein
VTPCKTAHKFSPVDGFFSAFCKKGIGLNKVITP